MTEAVFPGPEAARLDQALTALLPALGRRGRKRLVEEGRVLVDGRPARKGDLVVPGQTITVKAPAPPPAGLAPQVLERRDPWAALTKPAGMPTARGLQPGSLEEALPRLGLGGWILLNRLDTATSGIVLAAQDLAAARAYRAWQEAGAVAKWYLAVVHGCLAAAQTLTARIDDARRRTVRVLPEPDPSPLRHTAVFPLAHAPGTTLVLVRLTKGRRHHIRAHLASIGHPITGDDRYGQDTAPLFLHHAAIVLPDFTAACPPPWPSWPGWQQHVGPEALPPALHHLETVFLSPKQG